MIMEDKKVCVLGYCAKYNSHYAGGKVNNFCPMCGNLLGRLHSTRKPRRKIVSNIFRKRTL